MRVSDYLARFFSDNNLKVVFGMTGGVIVFLVDAFYRYGKTEFVCMQHEQAAAFAAEGYARITGQPGVAMATSGPGATNLITGIGSCYYDSSSVIFITGQVNTNDLKVKGRVRQQGFQETDIVSIVKPITKGAWMLDNPSEIHQILGRALELSLEGRPGPVLIDIPIDIQQQNIKESFIELQKSNRVCCDGLDEYLSKMYNKLSKSKKPLVLVGGGIRTSQSRDLFLRWIKKLDIPVVNSLMAVDVLSYEHKNRFGLIGSYGNRYSNLALKDSDLLLVLGSRLDGRQTGSDLNAFCKNKDIFHVDCDINELNNSVKGCEVFCCDLNFFLNQAIGDLHKLKENNINSWRLKLETMRRKYPDTEELSCSENEINPNKLMHKISRFSHDAVAYVVDVGQHQMWAAQSIEVNKNQRFLTSGGMGSMGFALPAAIGVAFALPGKAVVLISGDGGHQINIQELETVRRNNLPLKMIIINNHSLGMVRQFQEEYLEKRYQATCLGYSAPDFERISVAYGIPAKTIRRNAEVEEAIKWLWQEPLSPSLLNIDIPISLNAYPKVKYKAPINDMAPAK